jgi:Tol biopolymer transport system component
MRHTTGLAPHPERNQAAVTIESDAGSRLVVADFGGTNQTELFTEPGVGIASGMPNRIFDIKWSEQGDSIVYTQGFFAGQGTDASDVWIMRADGTERTNLTEGPDANDGVAAFSPDGEQLVFRSSRNGAFDLYLMSKDGSHVRQLTDDPARDNFPVFSPSGDAIAFSSDRDSGVDRLGFHTFDKPIEPARRRQAKPGGLHASIIF